MLLTLVAVVGCARAARDTTGFSIEDSVVVDAPFEETWQASKAVLREMELDIYTRDKRGTFIAYSVTKRRLLVPAQGPATTITLDKEAEDKTKVTIETTRQVYGVTPLTYPDWHDRQATDNSQGPRLPGNASKHAPRRPGSAAYQCRSPERGSQLRLPYRRLLSLRSFPQNPSA